jgi:hypothetical protein
MPTRARHREMADEDILNTLLDTRHHQSLIRFN